MNKLLKFSAHATTMMHERMIQEEWIMRAVTGPDTTEERNDRGNSLPETDPGIRWKNTPGNHKSADKSSSGDHCIL
jgi:hypothetical protein